MVEEIAEVKIGTKDLLTYIYSIIRNQKVTLLARGTNMKKAIDVGLIAQRNYDYKINSVKLYDSSYTDENQKERYVSNIEIELSK